MLEYFNPRCSPPWELTELEVKVSNAFRYTQGIQGNQHPQAILAALDACITPNTNSQQPNRKLISTITATELMQKDFPKPRWAVKPILPEGLTVIAGSPKIGKSWMAYSLACAVSVGGKALGAFQASQGKVLYLALEDNLRRLQDRLRKLSATHKESVSEHLMLSNSIPRGDDGGLKILEEWLDAYPDCRLVIIDTLARFSAEPDQKMNAYQNDYRALAPMQRLAMSKGIALVVITHLRKQSTSDPLEQVTGSVGITGAADVIWLLKRARIEVKGTLKITGRDVEEQELAVQFDKDTCQWTTLGNAVQYQAGKERQDILNYVKKAGEPVTPKEVAEALGKKMGNIKSLMRKMNEVGQIGKKDRGNYVAVDPFADYDDV